MFLDLRATASGLARRRSGAPAPRPPRRGGEFSRGARRDWRMLSGAGAHLCWCCAVQRVRRRSGGAVQPPAAVVCGCLRGAGCRFLRCIARSWGQDARALHCMTLRTLFDCPRAQKVREATSLTRPLVPLWLAATRPLLGASVRGSRISQRRRTNQQRLLTTARSRARPARSRRRSSISTRRPRGSGYLPS